MKYNTYDVEGLRNKFQTMSERGIRIEYAKILNRIEKIKYVSMPEDKRMRVLESLCDASMFLEGYLARNVLYNSGFYVRLDGQLCLDNKHGIDILHSARK